MIMRQNRIRIRSRILSGCLPKQENIIWYVIISHQNSILLEKGGWKEEELVALTEWNESIHFIGPNRNATPEDIRVAPSSEGTPACRSKERKLNLFESHRRRCGNFLYSIMSNHHNQDQNFIGRGSYRQKSDASTDGETNRSGASLFSSPCCTISFSSV